MEIHQADVGTHVATHLAAYYIYHVVSMEFHGIPWCTKLPKKEESVIFCMHPLRPTGQRTLGAPGGTGDVGGLAAPWHDGEIEGLVSVQWGSSHFLMGIQ
jgi:hypothetical protein